MKKSLLSLLLLILVLPLWGQDYIRRDFYGQGNSYQQALDALIHQVGQVVPFETPALAETYRTDISRSTADAERKDHPVSKWDRLGCSLSGPAEQGCRHPGTRTKKPG